MTMKISDELRKWCDDAYSDKKIRTINDLYAIADRIDSEMIELPKDADGVPIHVGDTVYLDDGRMARVTHIELLRNSNSIVCWTSGKYGDHLPSSLTHEHPDSFVRIADELEKWCDSADVDGDACGKPRDLAERIRRLSEKEGR